MTLPRRDPFPPIIAKIPDAAAIFPADDRGGGHRSLAAYAARIWREI
jgi:hypothetical protein